MMPCSEVHWKVLPALCRELALCMEKEKMPRGKIAAVIGMTPAAISQYISGKRGGMALNTKVKVACKALAKKIAAGKVTERKLDSEIAKLLVIAKGSRLGKEDPCYVCSCKE